MSEQKTFKIQEEVELFEPKWDTRLKRLDAYRADIPETLCVMRHEKDIPTHWPDDLKQHCRAEILKHRELAENQARDEDGDVWTFEWRDGGRMYQIGGSVWCRWEDGWGTASFDDAPMTAFGAAWFRKHCPADRFVTDDGRVLRFEMLDDGEAFCDGDWSTKTFTPRPLHHDPDDARIVALYKFRDEERARWRFVREECGHLCRKSAISVYKDDEHRGWFAGGGSDESASFAGLPKWVRTQAETMWRERNQKIESWWVDDSNRVEVWDGEQSLGHYDRDVAHHKSPWPPHILTEARAKFRANYTLKDDEIWFQGMPVRMTWNAKEERVDVITSGFLGMVWDERHSDMRDTWCAPTAFLDIGFTDESERLEAFYRLKTFYRKQLAEQTGKAEEKVVFEGAVTSFVYSISVSPSQGEIVVKKRGDDWPESIPAQMLKRCRVTIEPLGDE